LRTSSSALINHQLRRLDELGVRADQTSSDDWHRAERASAVVGVRVALPPICDSDVIRHEQTNERVSVCHSCLGPESLQTGVGRLAPAGGGCPRRS
jgi:hypothetical protein